MWLGNTKKIGPATLSRGPVRYSLAPSPSIVDALSWRGGFSPSSTQYLSCLKITFHYKLLTPIVSYFAGGVRLNIPSM